MLFLKTIRWKNFLSTGDSFSEMSLNDIKPKCIIGTNGSGKSTIIDAVFFGLFGKPFRDIKKGQLINSINKKNCIVEIEFNIGKRDYKVVRGIKPNVFEIYEDEQLVDQVAAAKDYQQYLEENILKLNAKSFSQIAIISKASYVPFMNLPTPMKREIVEDILDIKIFSRMNVFVKEEFSENKKNVESVNNQITMASKTVSLQKSYIDSLDDDRKKNIETKEEKVSELSKKVKVNKDKKEELKKTLEDLNNNILNPKKTKLEELRNFNEYNKKLFTDADKKIKIIENNKPHIELLEREIEEKKEHIVKLKTENESLSSNLPDENEIRKHKEKKEKLLGLRKNAEFKIETLLTEKDWFSDTESCPTCKQDITDEYRNKMVTERESTINDLKGKIDEMKVLIEKSDTFITENRTKLKDIQEKLSINSKNLNNLNNDITNSFKMIKVYEEQILSSKPNEDDTLEESIRKLNIEKDIIEYDVNNSAKQIDLIKEEITSLLKSEINTLESQISDLSVEINGDSKFILNLTEQIEESKKEKDINSKDELKKLKKLEDELEVYKTNMDMLEEKNKCYNACLSILKDDGIKTVIIKKYLPLLNKLINDYLENMEMFVTFQIDETFTEKIISRDKEDFTYNSFSEGEKARLDQAILFALREISTIKLSSSTNLLFLDEVFDGSLDKNGSYKFNKFLNTLKSSTIVISHNEFMVDRFDNVLQAKKINNYSVIEQLS